MHRRSIEVVGAVDFPVNDPRWQNSNEGGMFVRLVVVGTEDSVVCCGGYNGVTYDESLIGDDVHGLPDGDMWADNLAEAFHFPDFRSGLDDRLRYESISYLAVLTLGSTGWSGWSEKEGRYWSCRYEDLTHGGKALYDRIKKELYPEGTLYLQTWLDT